MDTIVKAEFRSKPSKREQRRERRRQREMEKRANGVKADKATLTEYKKLIVWYINEVSRRTALRVDLAKVCRELLEACERGDVYAATKRGVKGAVTRYAKDLAYSNVWDLMVEDLGVDLSTDGYYNHPSYAAAQQRILKAKMAF